MRRGGMFAGASDGRLLGFLRPLILRLVRVCSAALRREWSVSSRICGNSPSVLVSVLVALQSHRRRNLFLSHLSSIAAFMLSKQRPAPLTIPAIGLSRA